MTTYAFSTGGDTVLPMGRARVFFDGTFSTPRLQHPEGVAIGPDGWIWCGSENGQILRIAPDASAIEEVVSTGGFTLGLAFDGDRALFACDLKSAAVFRLDLATRELARFTPARHPHPELSRGGCAAQPSAGVGQPRLRHARPGHLEL